MIEENNNLLDNEVNGGMQVSVPNATAVLVLGIVSIATCFCYGIVGLICAIIALILAKKAKEAYALNPSKYVLSSYNNLKAGKVCAIIGLCLSIFMLLYFIVIFAFMGTMAMNPQGMEDFFNNLPK